MDITLEKVIQQAGKMSLLCKNKLNVWQDDGHGYLEFICKNCNNGEGLHEFYSLYPADTEEAESELDEESKLEINLDNNAIAQIVGGTILIGAKGIGLINPSLFDDKGEIKWHSKDEPFRSKARKISENVLSDVQAQAVWMKLQEFLEKSKKGEIVYNGLSHNCMDFPQIIFEATGLSGHYLNDFKQELNLYWEDGQICPGSIYAYAKYGGLRKLIEQIYAQMILGHTVEKVQEKAMCENVLLSKCWYQHEAIQIYEKAVANAYEVYLKLTYAGIEESTINITLDNRLVKNIRQQTVHGFQNIGLTTEASQLCLTKETPEGDSYTIELPLETQTTQNRLDFENVAIRVNTDREARIHWIEVEIVGKE